MALLYPEYINMAVPAYKTDQIIGIINDSMSIAAPTKAAGNTTSTKTFDTGFGDWCFFQGIFSTDGGSTWNDFGAQQPNLSTPGEPVLQTVTCYGGISISGTFTAYGLNYYDLVHSVGTAYTIQYKVVLFAKDNQQTITPIATNEKLYYQSKYNYQKIFKSGSFANTSGTTSISHNLGYLPRVRQWFIPTSDTLAAGGTITIPANTLVTPDWITGYGPGNDLYVDTTNANFESLYNGSTVAATVYYRIYLDK